MKLSPSFSALLSCLVAAPAVFAASVDVAKRALYSTCDSWGTTTEGSYTVYQVSLLVIDSPTRAHLLDTIEPMGSQRGYFGIPMP